MYAFESVFAATGEMGEYGLGVRRDIAFVRSVRRVTEDDRRVEDDGEGSRGGASFVDVVLVDFGVETSRPSPYTRLIA